MRLWWTTAYYELIKYSRMRAVLIVLIGLPLLLILLLGSALDTEIKPAKVALYIADQGEMRASIDRFWHDEAIQPFIKILEAKSVREVKDGVREGNVDYGVIIPATFSSQLLAGDKSEWLTFEGRFESKNIAADTIINQYMTKLNLQLVAKGMFNIEQSMSKNAQASDKTVDEAPITIHDLSSVDTQVFGNASAMQYYAISYLIMFLLYGGMTAAIALLNQKAGGTLQRLYAIPGSFKAIVFGIITGTVILSAIQAIIIIVFTSRVYGVDWGSDWISVALVCLFTTAAGTGLAITIASFARTTKTTQTLFSIIVFTMTFLSGGMTASIKELAGDSVKLTINYWAFESLQSIMSSSSHSNIWNGIGMLAVIAFVFSLIAVIRLPKVVKQHA